MHVGISEFAGTDRLHGGLAAAQPAPLLARDALVIVNANASGRRRSEILVAAIEAAAAEAEVSAQVATTGSTRELERALLQAGDRRVVLVGGDGSIHAAANLADAATELALLPAGRANNIANAMGIPTDPRAAARVALHAPARPLDVLRVEVGAHVLRCVEGLSAGFQALARASYGAVNSGDLAAGARSLLRTVRAYHPWHVDVEVDGRVAFEGEAAQVFVSNLPLFGFGFRVDPVADPADGRLEAIVAQAGTRHELVSMLARAYRGRHLGRPGVTLRRGVRAIVHGGLPLAGDAVPLGLGDAVVSVEPDAIRLAGLRP